MNIFLYRYKIINLYYYNNLKKESKLPAFIRKFGRSIRIFIAKKIIGCMTPQLKVINVKDVLGVHEPKRSHLAGCW